VAKAAVTAKAVMSVFIIMVPPDVCSLTDDPLLISIYIYALEMG